MSNYTQIILNSDGLTSVGTSSNYTVTLSNTITLNAFSKWEVAVQSASYSTPNPYVNKAIYIECDLADFSYVDGDKKRIVYKTSINHPTPLEYEQTHVIPQTLNWVKMTTISFNTINIKIEDSEGVAVPAGFPSSVTLSIRAVQ
jgi:hypothetical protein